MSGLTFHTEGEPLRKEEKKVEYLELIYDLIFVYIIGRNNSLLHHVENGFVPGTTFLAYVLCSLAIIQIWNFSTYYINMHGRNGVRDHVALFLNMYLLYYIGEGTRLHWESFQNQYCVAWALILLNIGTQYAIELRSHREEPAVQRAIRRMMIVLYGEALLVLLAIPVYNRTGAALTAVPILYGIVMTRVFADDTKAELVDFTHLSERAMLYVVFTFGEMIIAIASYFEGDFTLSSVYFSLMCFLIVAGLFLCYELLYDRIIDREQKTTGIGYMIVHIFLLFGMNNLTTSLEFMRDEEVAVWPKTLFLVVSFVLYFACLFALQRYARRERSLCRRTVAPVVVLTLVFAGLMLLLRQHMRLNILLSVLYVGAIFLWILRFSREEPGAPEQD
ncbi:MAG: low temperature requirement protein A [Oscillospiraceae bacterium]|nr:low temperature requirement protein A [Oscillospiraceae bacterium]